MKSYYQKNLILLWGIICVIVTGVLMFVQEIAEFALQLWQRTEGHGKSDQVLENGSSSHSDERGKRVWCLNRCLLGYFIETLGSPLSPTGPAEKPLTMSFRTRSHHLRQSLFLSLSTYGKLSITCSVPGAWKEQLCFLPPSFVRVWG